MIPNNVGAAAKCNPVQYKAYYFWVPCFGFVVCFYFSWIFCIVGFFCLFLILCLFLKMEFNFCVRKNAIIRPSTL